MTLLMLGEIENALEDPSQEVSFIEHFCASDENIEACFAILNESSSVKLHLFSAHCFQRISQRITHGFNEQMMSEFIVTTLKKIYSCNNINQIAARKFADTISSFISLFPKITEEYIEFMLQFTEKFQILYSIIFLHSFFENNGKPFFNIYAISENCVRTAFELCFNNIIIDTTKSEAISCISSIIAQNFSITSVYISDTNVVKEILNQYSSLTDKTCIFQFLNAMSQISACDLNPCADITSMGRIDRSELPDSYLFQMNVNTETVLSLLLSFIATTLEKGCSNKDILQISESLIYLSDKVVTVDESIVKLSNIINFIITKNSSNYFENLENSQPNDQMGDSIISLVKVLGKITKSSSNQSLTDSRKSFLQIVSNSVRTYINLIFSRYVDTQLDLNSCAEPINFIFENYHESIVAELAKYPYENLDEKRTVLLLIISELVLKIRNSNPTDLTFNHDKLSIITSAYQYICNSQITSPNIENQISIFIKYFIPFCKQDMQNLQLRLYNTIQIQDNSVEIQHNIISALQTFKEINPEVLNNLVENVPDQISDIDVKIHFYEFLNNKLNQIDYIQSLDLSVMNPMNLTKCCCIIIGFMNGERNPNLNRFIMQWILSFLGHHFSSFLTSQFSSFPYLLLLILQALASVTKHTDLSFDMSSTVGYEFVIFGANFLNSIIEIMKGFEDVADCDVALANFIKLATNCLSFSNISYGMFQYYQNTSVLDYFKCITDVVNHFGVEQICQIPIIHESAIKFYINACFKKRINVVTNLDILPVILNNSIDFVINGVLSPISSISTDSIVLSNIFFQSPLIDIIFNPEFDEKIHQLFDISLNSLTKSQTSEHILKSDSLSRIFCLNYNYFTLYAEHMINYNQNYSQKLNNIEAALKSDEPEKLIIVRKLIEARVKMN